MRDGMGNAGGEFPLGSLAMRAKHYPKRAPRRGTEEADFQRSVIEAADLFGWLSFHPYDSRRSRPGFPDLVLTKDLGLSHRSDTAPRSDGRLIFAELKSMKGRVSKAQAQWLRALGDVPGNIEVYVWRPSDMDEIIDLLRG
jgi:VRR-NUC domain